MRANRSHNSAWHICGKLRAGRCDEKRPAAVAVVLFVVLCSVCPADTFTNRKTGQVLHGYALGATDRGTYAVRTKDKGIVTINPAEWDVIRDRLGRNNKVVVLSIDEKIMYEIQAAALERAIKKASDSGPLFILLEISTPGGRVDLAKRICGLITDTTNCQIIAFVKGGRYGGAISAGAAVAFACDKIYIQSNASIGAAAMAVTSPAGIKDLKDVFGEELGEKAVSVWRAYLASLAEQHDRPGLLAMAMVDKDIEAVEVSHAGRRLFVDPVNVKPDQKLVRTWSRKGSLLTLTANEALDCGIVDEVVTSRADLLDRLRAQQAQLVFDAAFENAGAELRRAKRQFERLSNSIDKTTKQALNPQSPAKTLRMLRQARDDYKALIRLAKRYPDLNVSVPALQSRLNSIEVMYEQAWARFRGRPGP